MKQRMIMIVKKGRKMKTVREIMETKTMSEERKGRGSENLESR